MAAADTILVLDGLRNAQTTDSDVWTIDGEGESFEAVKTYNVVLPPSVSSARVIFNGNYDPDGARHHVRCQVTKVTSMAAGVPTKTEDTVALNWATIDPDDADGPDRMKETGAIDVSAAIVATLHIDVAISEAEATTGLEVVVQTRSCAGVDEWSTLTRFVGPIGTPTKSDFADAEAAGQTTLSITNPTAGNLNHVGKFIFIEHTTDITKCEIAFILECGADS